MDLTTNIFLLKIHIYRTQDARTTAPPYLLPTLTQLVIFLLFNMQIFLIILLAEARNLSHDARNLV